MRPSIRWLIPALSMAVAGCNCGNPAPNQEDGGNPGDGGGGVTDAGPSCGADTCGGCLPGCAPADVCQSDGGWACACTCTEADGGPTPDGGFDPYAFCAAIGAQECDWMIACHSQSLSSYDATEGRGESDKVSPSQRDACVAKLGSDPGCIVVAESWVKGRMNLDVAAYLACVNAETPASNCDRDINVLIQKCHAAKLITAATPIGSLCTFDAECTNGWCPGNAVACGACTAYLPINGAHCARDAQCDPASSFCPGPDQGQPGLSSCTAYLAVNTACDPNDFQYEQCGPGNVCSRAGALPTCQIGKTLGQACTKNNFECFRSARTPLPEETCATLSMDGGPTTTCQPIQTALGGNCDNGDVINILGTMVTVGQACHETEFCSTGQCTPRRMAGGSCTGVGNECAAGLQCVGGLCTAFVDNGASCTAQADGGNDCLNFLTCEGGVCTPDLALPGQSCSATKPCAAGFCPDAGAASCTAPQPNGASCDPRDFTQCQSYTCADAGAGLGWACQAGCWQ